MRRRALLLGALAALVTAPLATAKSFTLPSADVAVVVDRDGSVQVTERIGFLFDGPFTGAFREIPLRSGETVDQVVVADERGTYAPGASAELGSTGAPGTFGVTRTDGGMRVVWHYRASSELRTFRVGYRLRGLAVAEAYPELRASEGFRQLQTQLDETEGRIAVSRQVYNDTVLTYDTALETVPTNIVAGLFSFRPRAYFEVEETQREAPQVRF